MNKRILLLILGISLSVSAILAETSSYFAENTLIQVPIGHA